MKLKIALEWFLNPDHLPMIAGIETGAYKEAGLEVELIAPDEHYDGFEYLKKEEIDLHVNEPIHLFEHYFEGIRSMGCFFETRGGVMVKADRMNKLKNNQPIKVTTPAANEVTDKIGFEILKRYADKNGFELSRHNVEFVQTDFYHLQHLKKDEFDAAWLCFYNFEGIEAEYEGFDNVFIDALESPYPNFSALEIMTTQNLIDKKGEAFCKFIEVTNKMATLCQDNTDLAKEVYYAYSKEQKCELMDKIVDDTLTRFSTNIQATENKWQELYTFLEELDLVKLTSEQYNSIWAKHD